MCAGITPKGFDPTEISGALVSGFPDSKDVGWGLRMNVSDTSQGLTTVPVLDDAVGTAVLEVGAGGGAGVGGGTILGKEHRACPQADQIQDLLCWVTLGNLTVLDAHVPRLKSGRWTPPTP